MIGRMSSYSLSDSDVFAGEVRVVTDSVAAMLVSKNIKYGNSALDPVRIFSRATPTELLVRIDDKLSRLRSGQAGETEDVVLDLLGYLVLLRVQQARSAKAG